MSRAMSVRRVAHPIRWCVLGPNGGALAAARIGRSAVAGQGDAAASGLWVQYRPDGRRVAVELVGEGLEHGVVGSADQLTVLGGDAVEGAVAEPDGAVDGLIASDKFCWTRHGRLRLAW